MNNIKLSNLESVGLVLIIIINHVILNFSKRLVTLVPVFTCGTIKNFFLNNIENIVA